MAKQTVMNGTFCRTVDDCQPYTLTALTLQEVDPSTVAHLDFLFQVIFTFEQIKEVVASRDQEFVTGIMFLDSCKPFVTLCDSHYTISIFFFQI